MRRRAKPARFDSAPAKGREKLEVEATLEGTALALQAGSALSNLAVGAGSELLAMTRHDGAGWPVADCGFFAPLV